MTGRIFYVNALLELGLCPQTIAIKQLKALNPGKELCSLLCWDTVSIGKVFYNEKFQLKRIVFLLKYLVVCI